MHPFQTTRDDGRSDRQVIVQLVHAAEPETAYTFKELAAALDVGSSTRATRPKVYAAVNAANRELLKTYNRYLRVVRNVGYRVIRADEHVETSLAKRDSAEKQFRRGLEILKHARMDELTPTQRALHEGQLMIMSGIYQAVREGKRRQDKQDGMIADLSARVQKLERGFE